MLHPSKDFLTKILSHTLYIILSIVSASSSSKATTALWGYGSLHSSY